MGGIISTIQDTFSTICDIISLLLALNTKYKALADRVASSPSLPVPNPTSSYWLDDPPFPELVNVHNDIPAIADIVIIGSGITAAAAARAILELTAGSIPQPRLVVLEARQLCSGATGRNGGHTKTSPYEVYSMMKKHLGKERAVEIVRFQMRHLELLLEMGKRFPLGEVREVETVDLFLDEEKWKKAATDVGELRGLMEEFKAKIWEIEEAATMFDVNEHVKGAISYQAGALWPYRLITSIWDDLLRTYPNLSIATHMPVESVAASPSQSHHYEVKFPEGVIQTRHVLHATNGFAAKLVPSLKSSLTGAIGHMTAQKPGNDFPKYDGSRSWSVIYNPGFEYITQRPNEKGGGDLMIGGGFFRSKDQGLDQVGIWDDGKVDTLPLMHIRGCMQSVFEPNWGLGGGLIKAWTGILGVTGDFMPLVGRIPEKGNEERGDGEGRGLDQLARPGQWIAAGYCGEGMVWAWLCGTAVGIMIAGKEEEDLDEAVGRPGGLLADWFPGVLGVNDGRLKRANLKNLARVVE
ncbi:hypothetical protein QQS21_009673 [Conoideocrella luteorostrata]|uniref:FAD dependent oxidoreductase domain-containing protein n=1 Tax=Conoideocrella luteorostrata TaxID=1105319 RepID=A0AAJ0CIS5_9HYPO|nr:hypothetical protein QQS21_009673 [Conoideocrella luteorostrata]